MLSPFRCGIGGIEAQAIRKREWNQPPYWDLGPKAASTAAVDFALGTAGAGFGATTYNLKGGLGSASAVTSFIMRYPCPRAAAM